jgi:hypothetical protein
MTQALDVDVTTQTVRKYMIEHGIHEPSPQPSADELSARIDGDDPDDESATAAASDDESNESAPASDDGAEDDATDDTSETPPADDGKSPVDVHAVDADGDDATRASDATTDGGAVAASGGDESTGLRLDAHRSLADAGIDAPADLTVGDLVDAVVGSRTVYDVERALDCDGETARDLLRACDLLDIVRGRAAREEPTATETAVIERLDDALDERAT